MKQKLTDLYAKNGTKKVLASLLSILAGLLLGSIVVIIVGLAEQKITTAGMWEGVRLIFAGILSTGRDAAGALTWGFNAQNVGNMLFRAMPLIMTGLSVAVAFKTGLFNIGAPGQYLMGTLVSLSVALAGMGGFVYALTTANCTANGDVAGFGFLALAVMIFGNWKPLNIAGASLLFGLFKCIAAAYSSLDINGDGVYWLAEIGISSHVYRMLPYLITLVVLAFTSKKSRAPKAEGIPNDKGQR